MLHQAATSATAATFPLSRVATVAGVAAFPEVEERYRFQVSSKSLDIVRRHTTRARTRGIRARARGMVRARDVSVPIIG